ncbi:MAG: bacillithiol biosynthesis cysteine-adding enzyme BshC [Armatimonadota bacterium]
MSEQTPSSMSPLQSIPLADACRGNRLLADYLACEAGITDLFPHQPSDAAAIARNTRRTGDTEALSTSLVGLQLKLGAAEPAIANARLLADPTTPVVTVGQQPGLLTGPLYTPYKAISAITVARRLTVETGRPVVPVFWVGVDDADRDEVDHCAWWDRAGNLHTVRYPPDAGEAGQLVGDMPAGSFAAQVLTELESLLDGLPYAEQVRKILTGTLEMSVNFGDWFSRLMSALFSQFGLVICDPRLPELRCLAAEVIRRELSMPLRTTEMVNAGAAELQRRGYPPQLTKPEYVCNVFLLEDGRRQRIEFHDDLFHAGGKSFTQDMLLMILDQQPERFIPNAVLRPVIQEYLFASAAFIAGPNELGYWAELPEVINALGVPMPPVIPRAAATLVPPTQARLLREGDIEPLELLHEYDQVRYRLLAQAQPPAVGQAFGHGRAEIHELIARLSEIMAGVEPTLAQSALASQQRMLNEIERLEHKTLKAVERRSEAGMTRLEHAREVLFPGHGLQERTLNLFSVMAQYGPELPEQLLTLLDEQEGYHLFVEL